MSNPSIFDEDELEVGSWYLCVVHDFDGEPAYNGAPIYRYLGEGEWEDDTGNYDPPVLDPFLGAYISPNAVDEWVKQ